MAEGTTGQTGKRHEFAPGVLRVADRIAEKLAIRGSERDDLIPMWCEFIDEETNASGLLEACEKVLPELETLDAEMGEEATVTSVVRNAIDLAKGDSQ